MTVLAVPRKTKNHKFKPAIIALFIATHAAYIAVLVLALQENSAVGSLCDNEKLYPNVIIVSDGLFLFVYILALVFHKYTYWRTWNIISDDSNLPERL